VFFYEFQQVNIPLSTIYRVAQKLYALISSNINRLSKFYLFILLSVPSDVTTDVIGIWSMFFSTVLFVYKKIL